jgi:hypothetical protein
MTITELIKQLVEVAIREGNDFDVKIYDNYTGSSREFYVDKKFPESGVISLTDEIE